MADLPESTATVITDNNAGSLGDLVQTTLTNLTIGVNLTPLSWILLGELLILGIVASFFAVRLVQRRRKQLIAAIAQMIEHYTRRMDGYVELQQKFLEEQFHLDSEKAASTSKLLLENQQAFLRTLTQTLTEWDMQRFSRIHMELEQLNHLQLTTMADSLGLVSEVCATEQDDYSDEPSDLDEENDDLSMTEAEMEQEFEFTFEEETPQPSEPELEVEPEAEPEEEETLEFNFDEKKEEEVTDLADEVITAPAPKPRHRNQEINLLVPEDPSFVIDEPDVFSLDLSEEEAQEEILDLDMEEDLGSLNHPNPIRKKKKTK